MEKLIIENRSNLSMEDALIRVKHVVSAGKISKTAKGEQYCFMITWPDGVYVCADKNKKSDRLIVGFE
ncbi:hypothetical protein KAR91_21495 [Candidatus Pacearchaeota archaeon]|nr:hypothetical protein [Candidatus Pacearchaeota archaeon]